MWEVWPESAPLLELSVVAVEIGANARMLLEANLALNTLCCSMAATLAFIAALFLFQVVGCSWWLSTT